MLLNIIVFSRLIRLLVTTAKRQIDEPFTDWTDNEKKVLRATAAAQVETGVPVIIHPGRHPTAPAEIIRLLQEAGADVSKVVMSHLDRECSSYK